MSPVIQPFAVDAWARIFSVLKWVSAFDVLRRFWPRAKTHRFVDIWVCSHLVISAVAVVLCTRFASSFLIYIVIAYALIRVFEVIIYQINVLLFDEYRAKKSGMPHALRGYRRLVVLLLSNYAEIVLWFAAVYLALPEHFAFKLLSTERTVLNGTFSSFIVMSTFGEPNVIPTTSLGMLCVLYQSVVGLFMTALMLARFIGILPRPRSSDEMEDGAN